MNYRQAFLAITLASGLVGCASSPDYGLRYQDGSYYSPAGDGHGDYYVGAEPVRSYYYYDDFDLFFGSGYGWYGSPYYSYGGYCSVRYRYCPRWAWGGGYGAPFGETGFDLYFGGPWDPYWGGSYYPWRPSRPSRPPRQASAGAAPPPRNPAWADSLDQEPRPQPIEPRRPRPRPAPVIEDDADAFPFPAPGSGRRAPRRQEPAPAPAPRPRTNNEHGDGN